jgi:F-type H+-transporting ATPase subunit b
MQEILHAFGIDWRLISIQIFNFVALVLILWYFLYQPVLKLLNERQKKIEQGVKDAEDAEAALENADAEKTKIVTTAHNEAGDIVERAKKHADEKGSVIVSEAQDKAERIMSDAKDKGEELKTQAKDESEAEIAKLAVLAAEKVLKEKLN